jgi:hypothetical protein
LFLRDGVLSNLASSSILEITGIMSCIVNAEFKVQEIATNLGVDERELI